MLVHLFLVFSLCFIFGLLFKKVSIPLFCSFLFTGFIGKKLNLLSDINLDTLGEIGILLLLFSVGLEMSFKGLQSIKKFFLPSLAVIFCISSIGFLSLIYFFPLKVSFILGTAISFSSTAIFLFFLNNSKQTHNNLGYFSLSLLILQDLISVYLLLIIQPTNVFRLCFGLFIFSMIFLGFNFVINRFLYKVFKYHKDAFIFFILSVLLGFCFLSSIIGISNEIGAMCAGVVLSNSSFTVKIESITESIKEIFLMFFFMQIGANLNYEILINYSLWIFLGFLGMISIKIIGTLIGGWRCINKKHLIIISLVSCSMSETGFLIIQEMRHFKMISSEISEIISAIFLSSLFFSPIFSFISNKIITPEDVCRSNTFDIVIVGINLYSEKIAEKFKKQNVSYVMIDDSIDAIIRIKNNGHKAFLGDFFMNYSNLPIQGAKTFLITENADVQVEKLIKIKELYDHINIFALTSEKRTFNVLSSHDIYCQMVPSKVIINDIFNNVMSSLLNHKFIY